MITDMKGFAADIDMTLTGKGEPLPEITMKAFKIMHEHGIPLGLATGRQFDERMLKQAADWNLDFDFDFLVCMNGGQVYDTATGRLEEKEHLTCEEEREIMDALYDLIMKYEISVNSEGLGHIYAIHIKGKLEEVMKRHGWDYIDTKGDLDMYCSVPCFKILFRTEPEYSQKLRERFNEKLAYKYQIVETFPGCLEIMHQGIDKGSGVEMYASWHGMSVKDFMCFGDNENDNPMLEKAGWSVALLNANPKTKAICNDITDLECLEGGVGDYLFKKYINPLGWNEDAE